MMGSSSSIRSDKSLTQRIAGKLVYVIAIAAAGIAIYSLALALFNARDVPVVNAQSDMFLSQRIDRIEQRFNYIETRLGQIESQSRMPSVTPPRTLPGTSDQEIQFLRMQVDGLRTRLGELECGLLHVDERTLSAAQRSSRRRAAQGSTEKCRENSGAPVELSSRP